MDVSRGMKMKCDDGDGDPWRYNLMHAVCELKERGGKGMGKAQGRKKGKGREGRLPWPGFGHEHEHGHAWAWWCLPRC